VIRVSVTNEVNLTWEDLGGTIAIGKKVRSQEEESVGLSVKAGSGLL